MNELILLAYDYLDEYRSKDIYQEFLLLDNKIKTEYQDVLKAFTLVKNEYDEVMEIGRFHPDFKVVVKKYQNAKIELFSYDDIKRYLELEKMIESDLNETLKIFSDHISSNIPVFNELGFISGNKGGNCSGSCR